MKSIAIGASTLFLSMMLFSCASECAQENKGADSKKEAKTEYTPPAWINEGENITFEVLEMGCNMCRTTVQNTIEKFDGVAEVNVDLDSERATFIFHPKKVNPGKIAEAIRAEGYEVNHR
ncbi:MAG: heavy-metal-associated domain-containing protein [Saprospirales bacterium]|nr:MAG: heavy-metal-associated domain-containing protein [Saprospirales bacterium]